MKLAIGSALLSLGMAFSMPGLIPNQFKEGAPLKILASRLNSIKTHLPFDYYYLDFCGSEVAQYQIENVGEALTGDNIANTPFNV